MTATPSAPADASRVHEQVLDVVRRRLGAECPGWLADSDVAEPDVGAPPHPAVVARLDPVDAAVLVTAGLIEEDVRFGALFAVLQEPLAARRPCIGLLGFLLDELGSSSTDVVARCHELVVRGLLTVVNPEDPRAEWVVRVPVPIWDTLRHGRPLPSSLPPGLSLQEADCFPPLADVVVPEPVAPVLRRLPALVADGAVSAVVVRGMAGSGRRTLLGSLARTLGRDVLLYEGVPGDDAWRLLAPLATLSDAFPVVRAAPPAGQTLVLPALPGSAGTIGVTVGRSGGVEGPPTARAVTVELGACSPDQRRTLWQQGPATFDEAELTEVARSFVLTAGAVRRVAPLAAALARAGGRNVADAGDVREATASVQRQTLETLATRMNPLTSQTAPVLSPFAASELHSLVVRCRQRERLVDVSGGILGGTLNPGVRALFTGPSGTGKTLAARFVAAELHLDLYRVDLASVVNKYIGETERNLDEVLSRAEELGVVLLLDEGDALMTRRTDVSNANDRYANLETNFLLQRLETYAGIAIVTTNAGNRIDPAFLRRIDVTVEFVPPDADQRLQLWLGHLPEERRVDPALLTELAQRCTLTGGQIRNAALHAVLCALDRGTALSDDDLQGAVRREYRRMGAANPLGWGS